MNNMSKINYKDVLRKTVFFKEEIIKRYIDTGIYPNKMDIETKLKNIDRYLSIFHHDEIHPFTKFNSKKIKDGYEHIKKDIEILYDVIKEINEKDYIQLKNRLEENINRLEEVSQIYTTRGEIEMMSTNLGKTILYKDRNFKASYLNGQTIIDLGEVFTKSGALVSFVYRTNNDMEISTLKIEGDGWTRHISPYNYYPDTVKIPGNVIRNVYTYERDPDQIINAAVEILNHDIDVDYSNKYVIMSGRDKIRQNVDGETEYNEIDQTKRFIIHKYGNNKFYIYRGTYATIEFSNLDDIKNNNFENGTIRNLDRFHLFEFENTNSVYLTIETDGYIFSDKVNGIISGDILFYPEITPNSDFLIEETEGGEIVKTNMSIIIDGIVEDFSNISNIAVKELEVGTLNV